jgi:pterin-4a-carbinolamine dehydratase
VFTSHDLGGVTKKCIKMATLASKLFEEKNKDEI